MGSAGVFCFREKRGGGEGSVLQNLRCNNEIVVCVCLCSFPLANNDNSEKKNKKMFSPMWSSNITYIYTEYIDDWRDSRGNFKTLFLPQLPACPIDDNERP